MEIESKILLTQEEYEKLLERTNWSYPVSREDTYFRLPTFKEGQFVRIRETAIPGKGNTKVITYKEKNFEEGIENNTEEESLISNSEVIKNILRVSGFEQYFHKSTYVRDSLYGSLPLHLELKEVEGIKALEIECTGAYLVSGVKEKIITAFADILNIKRTEVESRLEKKDWRTLIKGKK